MPLVSASVAGPSAAGVGADFASAMTLINNLKPNLNYAQICEGRLLAGQMKSVCHLKQVPSVAFLFCHYPLDCEFYIKKEVADIQKLIAGGVRTVEIDNQLIKGVKCGKTVDLTCTGFLERWVGGGWLVRLDTLFFNGPVAVNNYIQNTIRKNILTSQGLKAVANDLMKIKVYMLAGKHNLICDLQGFFLTAGGFLVSDPGDIETQKGLEQSCPAYSPGTKLPTTKQVLDGLDLLIQDLSKGWEKKNSDDNLNFNLNLTLIYLAYSPGAFL